MGKKRFVRILAERAGQKDERHSNRYHEPLEQHIAIALGPLPHCTTSPHFIGPCIDPFRPLGGDSVLPPGKKYGRTLDSSACKIDVTNSFPPDRQ